MAIRLTKGERIEVGLSKVGIGLGWDPNEGTGFDFDLDASAFMLGENKQISKKEHFVFYGNLCGRLHRAYEDHNGCNHNECVEKFHCTDGLFGIMSMGDDTNGRNSNDGDDEILNVDLSKIPVDVHEIIFTVSIHEYEVRKQNFGQVRNSFIRVYNAQTNAEIAKYELDEDFSIETAVEFGRLYKRHNEWRFEAMGIGYKGGLEFFCKRYAKSFL